MCKKQVPGTYATIQIKIEDSREEETKVMQKLENIFSKKKITLCMCVCVELIILLAAALTLKENKDNLFYQEISGNNLIKISEDAGAFVSEEAIGICSVEQVPYEEAQILSCGPYISLEKGSYDITIDYQTDTEGNQYKMYCGESRYLDAVFARDKDGFFSAKNTQIICHIKALKNIEAFDIQTLYQGVGTFSIQKITIAQTNRDVKYQLSGLMLLFVIINLVVLFWKQIRRLFEKENYKYTVSMIGIAFFSSLLIFVNGYYGGHDSIFHFMRIEGVKEAILSGQWSAKIHPTHLKGYGYATGVMYPQLFLYIPAILRIVGFDLINSYKIFLLIINILTVVITFYSLKKMMKDQTIALLGTILYVLAPYRVMDLYYRMAVGEYCAIMGLPLIVYGLYDLIQDKREQDRTSWISLVIGYSIVIESHILSIILVGFFCFVVAVCFIKRFFKKENWLRIGKIAILTIAINLGFLTSFLDYYRLQFNSSTDTISKYGVTFAQLFTNQVLSDFPMHSFAIEEGIAGEIPLGLGYGLLFGTMIFVIYMKQKSEYTKLGITALILSGITILFSWYRFPWDVVSQETFLGKIIANIQFPWRFLEITTILLVIVSCVGIRQIEQHQNRRILCFVIAIIAILGFTNMTDPFIEKGALNNYITLNTEDVGTNCEYMLQGTDKDALMRSGDAVKESSEDIIVSNFERTTQGMQMEVVSDSDAEQFIEVPFLMYPGYTATAVDSKEKLAVTFGNNNVVRVILPSHFAGKIEVYFAGKWYWKVATMISVLSVIAGIAWLLWKEQLDFKRNKQ